MLHISAFRLHDRDSDQIKTWKQEIKWKGCDCYLISVITALLMNILKFHYITSLSFIQLSYPSPELSDHRNLHIPLILRRCTALSWCPLYCSPRKIFLPTFSSESEPFAKIFKKSSSSYRILSALSSEWSENRLQKLLFTNPDYVPEGLCLHLLFRFYRNKILNNCCLTSWVYNTERGMECQ